MRSFGALVVPSGGLSRAIDKVQAYNPTAHRCRHRTRGSASLMFQPAGADSPTDRSWSSGSKDPRNNPDRTRMTGLEGLPGTDAASVDPGCVGEQHLLTETGWMIAGHGRQRLPDCSQVQSWPQSGRHHAGGPQPELQEPLFINGNQVGHELEGAYGS